MPVADTSSAMLRETKLEMEVILDTREQKIQGRGGEIRKRGGGRRRNQKRRREEEKSEEEEEEERGEGGGEEKRRHQTSDTCYLQEVQGRGSGWRRRGRRGSGSPGTDFKSFIFRQDLDLLKFLAFGFINISSICSSPSSLYAWRRPRVQGSSWRRRSPSPGNPPPHPIPPPPWPLAWQGLPPYAGPAPPYGQLPRA